MTKWYRLALLGLTCVAATARGRNGASGEKARFWDAATGVEQARFATLHAQAGVELVSSAPAAARHELAVNLDDEIGAILDEDLVDHRDVPNARSGLPSVVVIREEVARRCLHQGIDRGHVGERRKPYRRMAAHGRRR